MSAAAVADRPQTASQPWKPKSKQRHGNGGNEILADDDENSPPLQKQRQNVVAAARDSPQRLLAAAAEELRSDGSPLLHLAIKELPAAKHPLENRWSMWYYKNDKAKDWSSNLRFLASCDTVEDFWGLYNHLKAPSGLPAGCDYSFFKEGIKPMWEDPKNVKGGRWLINTNRQQRSYELDKYWMEALLCLVGESFDPNSDEICGAVVNIRPKGDKLAIWTADAEKKSQVMAIGKLMRTRLNVSRAIQIDFQAHKDTITKSGSTTKKRYIV